MSHNYLRLYVCMCVCVRAGTCVCVHVKVGGYAGQSNKTVCVCVRAFFVLSYHSF